MKKMLALLLALLLAFAVVPAYAQEAAAEEPKPTVVTIFHTNDVHGRYNSEAGMGYAMAASFINEARNAGENVLVFDAGDTFHGTAFANYSKGGSIMDILNAMGYSAMTPGNHDYNYGIARLHELEQEATFPIVTSNILNADGSHAFKPYVILEVADKKIAVVGASNPTMNEAIHPNQIEGLQFGGIEYVEEAVAEAKTQADAVVVLSHWGSTDGYDPNSAALAAIDGVDLVIDGHSHTELQDIKQIEGNAPITQTGEYLNNLGKATLTFNLDGTLSVETSLIPNPKRFEDHGILAIIAPEETTVNEAMSEIIGETTVDLIGEREIVRTQESNWGDLACDIFLKESGADVALMNGGNIRQTVKAGKISIRDINNTYPFGNLVTVIRVTGEALKAAMEHGLAKLPDTNGGFPQIGGMTMKVDASKPVGERVVEILVGGEPLDPAKEYDLVTNDYIAAGGDGYEMFATCPMLLQMSFMDEVIVSYLRSNSPVSQETDGRIEFVG